MEFVWIEGGCFGMGSPSGEEGRSDDEGPVHEVCVDGCWAGKTEVTRGHLRKFAEAAGYRTEAEKEGFSYRWNGKEFEKKQGLNWRNPGFNQADSHPVVDVSWNDAKAMADWLSPQGNGRFRLPAWAQHSIGWRVPRAKRSLPVLNWTTCTG